jgi:hypothetical protein
MTFLYQIGINTPLSWLIANPETGAMAYTMVSTQQQKYMKYDTQSHATIQMEQNIYQTS